MNSDIVWELIKGKLPKIDSLGIKTKLDTLNSEQLTQVQLMSSNLKSPRLVFWVFSFLLGGFLVGLSRLIFLEGKANKIIACILLALCFLNYVLATYAIFFMDKEVGFAPILGIFWIIELFKVGKQLRMQNAIKLASFIANISKK